MIAQSKKIAFANSLRGLAALSVLISHYLGVFWTSRDAAASLINAPILPDQITTPAIVSTINYFGKYFNYGAFGVALFFLISGFVIPFSLSKLDTKSFIINRFFRIYPVYFIGFTFTLFAIFFASYYFGNAFPYSIKQVFIHYLPGLHDQLRINIDGIIWTLDIEIKFYLLCAILHKLFKTKNINLFLIPIALSALVLCINPFVNALATQNVYLFKLAAIFIFAAQYIVFMFIGTVFYYLHQRAMAVKHALSLVLLLFFLFALMNKFSLYGIFNLTWSYGFALLFFAFAFAYQTYFKGNKIINFFADISYPLYVVHGVCGYALLRILINLGISIGLALGVTVMFAVSVSFILHKWIEMPSQQTGKLLNKFLSDKDNVGEEILLKEQY